MNATASLTFPGSRALAAWWRLFAGLRPQAFWVAHLALHRVEAAALLHIPDHVEPLTRTLLNAIALENGSAQPLLPRLHGRLHLEPALLRRVLAGLVADGLLAQPAENDWRLTPAGRQALQQGQFPRSRRERGAFYFAEPLTPGTGRPPHFLALAPGSAQPWAPEGDWAFDVALLAGCVHQSAEWKERYGFPTEVAAVAGGATPASWLDVVVDRPERLLAALLRVATPTGPQLQAFAARPEGWALQSAPAFVIKADWHEAFPELTGEPTEGQWRQAWAEWCEPRDITAAEAEACVLEAAEEQLRVAAPAEVIDRLRAARSDALKGEAWLLAGDGLVRRAAVVELRPRAGG